MGPERDEPRTALPTRRSLREAERRAAAAANVAAATAQASRPAPAPVPTSDGWASVTATAASMTAAGSRPEIAPRTAVAPRTTVATRPEAAPRTAVAPRPDVAPRTSVSAGPSWAGPHVGSAPRPAATPVGPRFDHGTPAAWGTGAAPVGDVKPTASVAGVAPATRPAWVPSVASADQTAVMPFAPISPVEGIPAVSELPPLTTSHAAPVAAPAPAFTTPAAAAPAIAEPAPAVPSPAPADAVQPVAAAPAAAEPVTAPRSPRERVATRTTTVRHRRPSRTVVRLGVLGVLAGGTVVVPSVTGGLFSGNGVVGFDSAADATLPSTVSVLTASALTSLPPASLASTDNSAIAAREFAAASRDEQRSLLPGCDGSPRPGGVNGQLKSSDLCTLWDGHTQLRADAAVALAEFNQAFVARFGADLCLSSGYRTLAQQRAVKAEKGGLAAAPGKSNHGWGLAVDLCQPQTTGAKWAWLKANGKTFGWENPAWAQTGGSGPHEPWHWEYTKGVKADGEYYDG